MTRTVVPNRTSIPLRRARGFEDRTILRRAAKSRRGGGSPNARVSSVARSGIRTNDVRGSPIPGNDGLGPDGGEIWLSPYLIVSR